MTLSRTYLKSFSQPIWNAQKDIIRHKALAIRSEAKANFKERFATHDDCRQVCEQMYDVLHHKYLSHLYPASNRPVVAGYYPIGSEFDLRPLLAHFFGYGFPVCLPVVQEAIDVDDHKGPEFPLAGKHSMRRPPLSFWYWIPGSQTTAGAFNIQIPIREQSRPMRPDVILAPVVAFDSGGRRIGYGGGFYDRTIEALRRQDFNSDRSFESHDNSLPVSRVRNPPLTVCGVAFDDQRMPCNILAAVEEPFDQRLDVVITENNIYFPNKDP